MLLVQKGPFFQSFFFRKIQVRKMSITIFQNQKTPFQAIKTQSLKSQKKIDIFAKVLTHGFGRKMAIFPRIFLRQYKPGKCVLRYSRTNNHLSRLSIRKVQKVKKLTFFQRVNPCFWSKNGHFTNFFFQAIQARKMSFTIFQKQKKRFQGIKTQSSKSRKIDIFPTGLTHCFGRKMAIFPTFFFRQYRRRKFLLRYSRTKKHLSRL